MNRTFFVAGAVVLALCLCSAVAADMPYTFVDDANLIADNGWNVSFTLLEPYTLDGTVVGLRLYADEDLPYSPADVAVAWGLLADPSSGTLSATMGERQLSYVWSSHDPSIDGYYVTTHVSNNHVIPRTPVIYEAVLSLSVGDVISMEGFLVEAEGTRTEGNMLYSSHWGPSSLVRDDEGPGSCEIFLVTRMWVNGTEVAPSPSVTPPAPVTELPVETSFTLPARAGAQWERMAHSLQSASCGADVSLQGGMPLTGESQTDKILAGATLGGIALVFVILGAWRLRR